MEFSLSKSIEILERTPGVLIAMLTNISEDWTTAKEGENSWSAKEVVAHLIVCEKTNWMVRAKIILSDAPKTTFVPIDMNMHFDLSKNSSMQELLNAFKQQRAYSMDEIKDLNLVETDLIKTGNHPTLGEVNLRELISTWVTHDLSHIAQISRVIAKQNKDHVGSFSKFLKILNS